MTNPTKVRPLRVNEIAWGDVLDRDADNDIQAGVTIDDFYAYMPMHNYLFIPSRDLWPAASVNARVAPIPVMKKDGTPARDEDGNPKFVKASTWIDRHRPVEQMTWIPGEPLLIRDRLVSDGGWIARPGCACINLYRPPMIADGDAARAGEWLNHVARVYPDDRDHIVRWLAHRVQRPHEKINHALVLGGLQGIGKDTLVEPAKVAVGPWNFVEVAPTHLLGRFNGFLKSVILRVNEARDLGDVDRFAFYDHLKAITAAPPDVLRVDEKNLREYVVFNVCGIIITTNHKSDGLYLPADDRRHYVAWSTLTKDDFARDYWTDLYAWYAREGYRHVAAYLARLDLSGFDPKAPPPKTEAFWDVVNANRAPEEGELSDVLDALDHPMATTIATLAGKATTDFATWLRDRRSARQIPYRLESVGYVPVRNPSAKDGLWVVEGRRAAIYAKQDLSLRDRLKAARTLADSDRE